MLSYFGEEPQRDPANVWLLSDAEKPVEIVEKSQYLRLAEILMGGYMVYYATMVDKHPEDWERILLGSAGAAIAILNFQAWNTNRKRLGGP